VPVEGFKALISNRGKKQPFTIQGAQGQQIKAQTCFNRLLLPIEGGREEIEGQLLYIVAHSEDWSHFGME